ncbi:MAG: SLC45 family MFS transporter [Leptolyngbyaceae cyanobacterium SM2_5_2]|nr:SLC45 family MFS transporter [Leptolyngbyaceae cyanobacterium SM2_5_2]
MVKGRRARPILWAQVWGLAAVQGAITLAWVVYNLYLVDLLTSLGFPQGWAIGLLIVENGLAMITEPLMGVFSDRLQHQIGTRFPLISLGVILAAGLFVGIPTVLVWGQNAVLRWMLPLLLVAWALAMTLFRSPALSLLGRYAFQTDLPQAASILTLVGGLAGAMAPLANQFILDLGPLLAFAMGSLLLLLAMVVLRWAGPNRSVALPTSPGFNAKSLSWVGLTLVFGVGLGTTLGFRLMLTTFPILLQQRVAEARVAGTLGMIFVALALAAIPTGALANRLGNQRAMVLGLGMMAIFTLSLVAVQTPSQGLALAALLGATFSLVANGSVPFALSLVPPEKAGLGTGLYFSGGALALCVWGGLLSAGEVAAWLYAGLGALAFLLAGVCVGQSRRYRC